MCGISGFNWEDEKKIQNMVNLLSHRGPDANGVFIDKGISLGHNRLSIIDLSQVANQPMTDNSGDLTIVYNGEIYNFKELKSVLKDEYEFKTGSDTEVILAGYLKWGKDVVERLNGMFAFAIWDKRDGSLFCARDHVGMKPLYYYWDGAKFIFASEIKAIFTHDISKTLDVEAFNHYLRILYVPEPMTLIKNIYKLPPSHTLRLEGEKLAVEKYSQNKPASSDLSYTEVVSELRRKVMQAVERHLVSDVPVGVYLSGGIDSSTVLYCMSRFQKDINTFTIGFDLTLGQEQEKFNSDFILAQKTADFFNTTHHEVRISVSDALSVFEEASIANSDPISNPTLIAMLSLARHARSHVKVALTGNGGDELFGGYDRYKTALLARFLYTPSALFAKFMFQKDDLLSRSISSELIINTEKIKGYYQKYLTGSDMAEKLMSADRQSWLPEHFFMLSDKMSMANSLEERMPFADKEIVQFGMSLPRKYKVDLRDTKKVLKDAFRDDLPPHLFNQPKRGWFSPAAKWLRNEEFADMVRKTFSPEYYQGTKSIFNWASLELMLEKHIDKREYNLTMIWAIFTFQVWAKQHNVEL